MNLHEWDHLLKSVSACNTLPLTSRCNLSCVFCSNVQNTSVPVLRVRERPVEELLSVCEFLDQDSPLIIGESATRFYEGEPFLYPDLLELLKRIRGMFPSLAIRITTNGELLEPGLLGELLSIGGISLTISLNCLSAREREVYLKGRISGYRILDLVSASGLDFSISTVVFPKSAAMSIREEEGSLLEFLREISPYRRTLRIFMAGLSSETLQKMKVSLDYMDRLGRQLSEAVHEYRRKCDFPVIFEPYFLKEFCAQVEGVENSSGRIEPGDVIVSVNGRATSCGSEVVDSYKDGGRNQITLRKPDGRTVDPFFLQDRERPIVRPGISRKLLRWMDEYIETVPETVILVSRYAEEAFKARYERVMVPVNGTFGGNIRCYGLYTFKDINQAVNDYFREHPQTSKAIVSPALVDPQGFDIMGRTVLDYDGLCSRIIIPPEL